jgi:hypothetical protein
MRPDQRAPRDAWTVAPTCEIWLSHRISWASVDPLLPHFPRTKAEADAKP